MSQLRRIRNNIYEIDLFRSYTFLYKKYRKDAIQDEITVTYRYIISVTNGSTLTEGLLFIFRKLFTHMGI